ncbi:hypothetical protein BGZ61DRAFT_443122, partial [Ilyonectria robusta]|uniref:uncharacterized protein n=1 Tax=Ilyonectria robusta TaxID=1079257 RepID=UPI001E8D1CF6
MPSFPPSRDNQSPTAAQHFENMLNHDRVPAPTSEHPRGPMAVGRLHPVRCSVQAMPMACQDCHVMPAPPPPNVSWKTDGRLSPAFGKRANEMCHDNNATEGTPATDRNPLKRDRTRLSLVPERTGLNQVEAEAGNPASKRARKRIRQGDAKRRERRSWARYRPHASVLGA